MSAVQLPGATIDVLYALYEKKGELVLQVQSTTDLLIERGLRNADTNKLVSSFAAMADQRAALHEHVLSVAFDVPVEGHVIVLDGDQDSRWDPITKKWLQVIQGASIYYPVVVVGQPGASARLFLAVWTKGALGKPAATAEAGASG